MAVEDERLRAVQLVGVAVLGGGCGDARLVPLARRLGVGERGDGLAGGDAREVLLLRGVVARLHQRVAGEHDRGEERRAQQRTTHLLEHDAELDESEARPTELLGDVQTLEAHLLAHLRPHRGVVAVLGLHLLADRFLGALVLEERAHGLAEFFLFFGEGKVHGGHGGRVARHCQICLCTHVDTIEAPDLGVRELRSNLPEAIRRARRGTHRDHQRRPSRGPTRPARRRRTRSRRLIGAGAVIPPRRTSTWRAPAPVPCGRHRVDRCCESCGDDRRPRHERLQALAIDGPQRRVALAALDGDDVWAASAMALTEASRHRPSDRRADPATRPRGRHPPHVGPPPRRARRSAVSRPGRRARPVATRASVRRHPLRRRRTPPRPDPIRHVRPGPHRRGDGPRLRRRVDLKETVPGDSGSLTCET